MRKLVWAIIIISALTVSMLPKKEAQALNGYIDPNATGSGLEWTGTNTPLHTNIDDAVRQPTAGTADNISAPANKAANSHFRMSTIAGVSSVSDVTVWVYHNDGNNGILAVQLYDDDEVTTRSNAVNVAQATSDAWHSVTFSGLSLTQAQLDSLTVTISATRNGGGPPATVYVYAMYADVTYSGNPTYEQSGYRMFNNQNSTDVGSTLAALNTTGTLATSGDAFRVRTLIHVSDANLSTSGQNFKLQYVDQGSGSCASPSGGTPGSYTDVTTSTLIAYNDNVTPADGSALTGNANDPSHSGHTIRNQTYEESNGFTNSQASIAAGEDGMWDFSLIDNGAASSTTYCLRIVQADGTTLGSYTQYPSITTASGVLSSDIVNSGGEGVSSPSVSFTTLVSGDQCQTSTGSLGTSSERIRVSNNTGNPAWVLSIAANAGNTSNWSSGVDSYDFNDGDGTPAGCQDGGDSDSLPGQLSIDPSVASITPESGCTSTGLSLASQTSFVEGVTDSITLASASAGADTNCYWDVTGIGLSQSIPEFQASGNYALDIIITTVAN